MVLKTFGSISAIRGSTPRPDLLPSLRDSFCIVSCPFCILHCSHSCLVPTVPVGMHIFVSIPLHSWFKNSGDTYLLIGLLTGLCYRQPMGRALCVFRERPAKPPRAGYRGGRSRPDAPSRTRPQGTTEVQLCWLLPRVYARKREGRRQNSRGSETLAPRIGARARLALSTSAFISPAYSPNPFPLKHLEAWGGHFHAHILGRSH